MDWSLERYVRLYTRDTGTWALLSWQARCVLPLLMRKLDRSGRLSIPGQAKPEVVVAKLLDVPERVVKPGLVDLAAAGIVELTVSGLVMPNFSEAQETRAPSTERVKKHRARKKSEAANNETFPKRDETVCVSDETPSLAVPSLAVPTPPTPSGGSTRRAPDQVDEAATLERLREQLAWNVPPPEPNGSSIGQLRVRDADARDALRTGFGVDEIVGAAQWLSAEITGGRCSPEIWGPLFWTRWLDSLVRREIPARFRSKASAQLTDEQAQAYVRKHRRAPDGWAFDCFDNLVRTEGAA